MQSTFSGIEIGKRSLQTHNVGLNTIGHNLSNASVEGYSRQRVQMNAVDPLYLPGLGRAETPGQIGQGVEVQSVSRVHDQMLENRIVSQSNNQGFWAAKDKYLLMVEKTYNEPSDFSVRSLMDRFWESWQVLADTPDDEAARLGVINSGKSLMDGIHQQHKALTEIRDMVEQDVTATVDRVNAILDEVSKINEQIVKVKAVGDNPNDLLDQRDRLVREMSGYINITVSEKDPNEYTIHTGGMHLLQGTVVTGLEAVNNPQNEGYVDVRWKANGELVRPKGGRLAGLIELRDTDVRGEIQQLNSMTVNFVDLVNENHRKGFGLNGTTGVDFFTEYPFVNNIAGNYDSTGNGEFDSTYLFRITGAHALDPQEQIGLAGTITLNGAQGNVDITYNPTDTVGDLITRINRSGAEVVARLNNDGRLQLKATQSAQIENPDFVIRRVEDSGQFLAGYAGILAGSGPANAFTSDQPNAATLLEGGGAEYAVAPVAHPAGWIEMNPQIVGDINMVAAGFGVNGRAAEAGDGSAAVAIASLRNTDVMVGKAASFDDYFSTAVAQAGLKGEMAERALETENLVMKELNDMRESLVGVNIDEELANMIKFQHGYTAASRFITQVTQMIDTIINRMGV